MDIALNLDRQSDQPLHQQLYEELRQAILTQRLLPNQRLPSTRALAKSLGLSRITVTQSYERLLSEGYLQTIVGSGTYVCTQIPDELLRSTTLEPAPKQKSPEISLSAYGESLLNQPFSLLPEIKLPISFRYGRPALDQFPIQLWRKLLSHHCRTDISWLDYATDFQGYQPLRQAISRYLSRARAVQCDPDQIVITNGTQQALDLVMRLLMKPGETIAVEDPGYVSAKRIFLSHRVNLLPIPVDESGLIVEKLAYNSTSDRASDPIQPVRCVYVTPSHQFPTGAILSLPRRLELLTWAQQTGAFILEDDYDSEYRYGHRPIPALQGLANSDSVLYVGTFSKVLFPSLRIGYLVLPPHLVALFAQAKWLCDRQLPGLEQRVLTDFIEQGHLESHIRKMRSYYDQNRQVLVESLKFHFGDQVTVLGEQAGIHVMIRLQVSLSDAEIVHRAVNQNVEIMSAQPHYLHSTDNDRYRRGEFILGYSELSADQIQEGIRRLAKALEREENLNVEKLT